MGAAAYDALGPVLTVTYGNGATITYACDALGNRTTLSQTAPTAVQSTLSANPTAILLGSSASLTWTTLNATSVSINNGGSWISPPASGGAGGAAGYCVRKNGHTVPITNNGSTSGTIG